LTNAVDTPLRTLAWTNAALENVVQLPLAVAVIDLRVTVDQPDRAALALQFVVQRQLQLQLLRAPLIVGIEHGDEAFLTVV